MFMKQFMGIFLLSNQARSLIKKNPNYLFVK